MFPRRCVLRTRTEPRDLCRANWIIQIAALIWREHKAIPPATIYNVRNLSFRLTFERVLARATSASTKLRVATFFYIPVRKMNLLIAFFIRGYFERRVNKFARLLAACGGKFDSRIPLVARVYRCADTACDLIAAHGKTSERIDATKEIRWDENGSVV